MRTLFENVSSNQINMKTQKTHFKIRIYSQQIGKFKYDYYLIRLDLH